MPTILIIEDEPDAAESLRRLIAEADPSGSAEIVTASTFEDAKKALYRRTYDLVFCDLLLLPAGSTISDGKIRERDDTIRPFSPEDWNEYVLDKGGIEVIRLIRVGGTKIKSSKDVPIIITSYFDSLPGYMKTVRAVNAHPYTLLLPKFYKNPAFKDYSHDSKIRAAARSCIQQLLIGNLPDAEFYSNNVREELFERRRRRLDALRKQETEQNKIERLFQKYMVLTYNFTLLVEFDPRNDPELDWRSAMNTEPYQWSNLYESWEEFRDSILMNPKVPVRFSLVASNISSSVEDVIPLPSFSSPIAPYANSVKACLRYRTVLAYLAFVAEPPAGLFEYGWTVSPNDLQQGAMSNIEKLPGVIQVATAGGPVSYNLRWPNCESSVSLDSFVAMRDGNGSPRNYIKEVRDRLTEDLERHYVNTKDAPFGSEHIVVCPNEGYFFNGDLRIGLFDYTTSASCTTTVPPSNYALERIFLLPMGKEQIFECVDGKIFTARDIETRLQGAFREVTRFETFFDVEQCFNKGDIKDGDCILCAPVDASHLGWWDSEVRQKNASIRQMLDKNIRIILVPSTEAGNSVGAELFHRLNGFGIHSIYTANFTVGIPEAKMLDAILCSGPRVKYIGEQMSDLRAVKRFAADVGGVEKELGEAYKDLIAAGALGDQFSGSASVRWNGGICMVTASQTNKETLSRTRITGVICYSPSWNQAQWVGKYRPSSSTPWHCRIYQHRHDINAIVHTHNKLATYSPRLSKLRTQRYTPYGTIWLGEQILNQIHNKSGLEAQAVILNGHGEVAVGKDLNSCVRALVKMHRLAKGGPVI